MGDAKRADEVEAKLAAMQAQLEAAQNETRQMRANSQTANSAQPNHVQMFNVDAYRAPKIAPFMEKDPAF